jgi:hypothetical protein
MRQFAARWPDEQIVQTLSAQIDWSHHQVFLDAFGDAPDPLRMVRGQSDRKPLGSAIESNSISSKRVVANAGS